MKLTRLAFRPLGKVLCAILSAVMLIQMIPAAALSFLHTDESADRSAGIYPEKEPLILYELSEEREAGAKKFLLNNGAYLAASYPQPVHFKTDSGWEEYDNRLIETEDGFFENRKSDQKIRAAKKSGGDVLFSWSQEDFSLSWHYEEASETELEVIENKENPEGNDRFLALPGLTQEAWYRDFYEETDLQIFLSSVGIKENLILHSESAPVKWILSFEGEGLTVQEEAEGNFAFLDAKGKERLRFSAPFLQDAEGAFSSLNVSLLDVQNGKVRFLIEADETWLKDEKRAFPVTVDPVLVTSQAWGQCSTGFVAQNAPDTAYTNYGSLYMGYEHTGNLGVMRSFFRCNSLPTLTTADVVVDARVHLLSKRSGNTSLIEVRRVTSSWNTSSLTWNNRPGVEEVVLDYKQMPYLASDTYQWFSWEITPLVKEWYAGTTSNYGVEFRASDESSAMNVAWFFSSTLPDSVTARPCLVITYRNRSGFEDHLTYVGTGTGFGAISVDPYNGNLLYTQPLTEALGGEKLPVSVSLTYNANADAMTYNRLGIGMQTNFHQQIGTDPRIASSSNEETRKYRYFYRDGDGTIHYFYFANAFDTTGTDEDGLGYTLKVNSGVPETSVSGARYLLTDREENKMTFNGYGQLLKLETPTHQSVTLQYSLPAGASVPRFDTITDGAGRIYTFSFQSDGTITSIRDPQNRTTLFSYSSGRLASVVLPDGSTTTFGYTAAPLLNAVSSSRNNTPLYNAQIEYADNILHTAEAVTVKTAQNNVCDAYRFLYHTNETDVWDLKAVLDQDGRAYTLQFNDFGQCTGVISNRSGSARFYTFGTGGGAKNKLTSSSRTLGSTRNLLANGAFQKPLAASPSGNFAPVTEGGAGSAVIDATKGVFSAGSLKIQKTLNIGAAYAVQEIHPAAGSYTFSAYANTFGETLSGSGAALRLEIRAADGTLSEAYTADFTQTDAWERFSIPAVLPSGCYFRAVLGFAEAVSSGKVWFDNAQLEPEIGETAFNLIENGDFSRGSADWTASSGTLSSSALSGDEAPGCLSAITLSSPHAEGMGAITQSISVSGEAGDSFSVGAWAKAASAPLENGAKTGDAYQPSFALRIRFFDSQNTLLGEESAAFNPDVDSWQFLGFGAMAPAPYVRVEAVLDYTHNVNSVSFTGVTVCKEAFGQSFAYDSDGNVVFASDLADSQSAFTYQNHQLTRMIEPNGNDYTYAYTDERLLSSACSSGEQEYRFSYDSDGNLIRAELRPTKRASELEEDKIYFIESVVDGGILDAYEDLEEYSFVITSPDYSGDAKQKWLLEDAGNGNWYLRNLGVLYEEPAGTFCASLHTVNDDVVLGGATAFCIEGQSDGSFVIYPAAAGSLSALEQQEMEDSPYVNWKKVQNKEVTGTEPGSAMRWYFYDLDFCGRSIVSGAAYSANGNTLASITNAMGSVTTYGYDAYGRETYARDAAGTEIRTGYDNASGDILGITATEANALYEVSNSYSYDAAHRLISLSTDHGLEYEFSYDDFGRSTAVFAAGQTLASTGYDAYGRPTLLTYGNGALTQTEYDALDRVVRIRYNQTVVQSYYYNSRGELSTAIDHVSGRKTCWEYDLSGRAAAIREYATASLSDKSQASLCGEIRYTYAEQSGDLESLQSRVRYEDPANAGAYLWHEETRSYRYGTGMEAEEAKGALCGVSLGGTSEIETLTFDELARVKESRIDGQFYTRYTYLDIGTDRTTALVSCVENEAGVWEYEYDEVGRITRVVRFDNATFTYSMTEYTYDFLGEIYDVWYYPFVEYVNGEYVSADGEWTWDAYEYDEGGNLVWKRHTEYSDWGNEQNSTEVEYYYDDPDWTDLLTEYDGESIEYDAIGNPTLYRGETLVWQNGRELQSFGGTSFSYDASGKRLSKTTGGVTTTYLYSGDSLIGLVTAQHELFFVSGVGGAVGFDLDGDRYYYLKNAQGDVEAILNDQGQTVGTYRYDAWGKILEQSGSVAALNPLRYRGYLYDAETGLYFLQTRYYDPETGRFLNADNRIAEIGGEVLGYNLFAYCFNNPIMYSDDGGTWPWSSLFKAIAVVAVAVVAVTVTAVTCGAAAPAVALATGGIVTTSVGTASTIVSTAAIVAGTATIASAVAEKVENKVNDRSHTVYKLVDPKDNTVKYVGRTVNPAAREMTHRGDPTKKDLVFVVIKSGLSYEEARGLEQIEMLAYNTKEYLNKINGISPTNRNLHLYMAAGRQVAKYLSNKISNEILYWME